MPKTIEEITDKLRREVEQHRLVDLGPHAQIEFGTTRERLYTAVQKLVDEEDYEVSIVKKYQVGTTRDIMIKVLHKKDGV